MQLQFCTDPAVDYGTKATIFVTDHAAYVGVTETKPPSSADIKLPGGKGAIQGLRELIAEADARMIVEAHRVDRMRRALTMLERANAAKPDYSRIVRLDSGA